MPIRLLQPVFFHLQFTLNFLKLTTRTSIITLLCRNCKLHTGHANSSTVLYTIGDWGLSTEDLFSLSYMSNIYITPFSFLSFGVAPQSARTLPLPHLKISLVQSTSGVILKKT